MSKPTDTSPHMLREIFAQPEALRATLEHYVDGDRFRVETCDPVRHWLRSAAGDIVFAASGSSRHAALVGETLIEDASGLHVDVEYASEYPYRSRRAEKSAAVCVVSQSGETADTLASLRRAAAAGFPTLAITNVPGSSMHREAAARFPTLAGREQAIPATKSFTTQLLNMRLLSLLAAESTGTAADIPASLRELANLHILLAPALEPWNNTVAEAAARFDHLRSFLFLGRGVHFPIAREGALKLKESAYLHAEGYPSGELKHGPNALVGRDTALIFLATHDPADSGSRERHAKTLQLLEDMQKQGATTLAIANDGDPEVPRLATHTLTVPSAPEPLLPIVEVIPLQLLAFHMAMRRGIDVDSPRNLSKAVLTE